MKNLCNKTPAVLSSKPFEGVCCGQPESAGLRNLRDLKRLSLYEVRDACASSGAFCVQLYGDPWDAFSCVSIRALAVLQFIIKA